MKIVVCISNVPDTTTKIKFRDSNTFDPADVQWIINPWDELALTRALELKEDAKNGITQVTVVNVGLKDTEPTIRKALAIGADNGIRINAEPVDAYFVASQIAGLIKKEPYDIVLCGIESSDFNGAMTGGMLAEFLGCPSVSSVSSVNIENGNIIVNREMDGGSETLSVSTPFVAIVQKGIAISPRIPSMRGIMTARTKQLRVDEPIPSESLVDYGNYQQPPKKAACKMVPADNIKELVQLLHNEAKVI